MSFWTKLFAGNAPAKQPAEDRSQWIKLQYAQAIANKLRATPNAAALDDHGEYLRALGQEISDKFGLVWMQEIWNAQMKEFGPLANDLSQLWIGISAWKTPQDADALAAELIYIGRHCEYTVAKDDGSARYDYAGKHKRAKRIGEFLDRDGGIETMRYARSLVRAAGCDAIDLELCWDGVGQWRH
ncbi:MAG: hypothetical protein M3463_16560 [Verrucomicrobiota bacterium]|nr:hypothetical protein [Verrucomicrobiota bacterium]